MLPVLRDGHFAFDDEQHRYDDPHNILWSALAEKAYAQLAESGWARPGHTANLYASINKGMASNVMEQITGRKAEYQDLKSVKEKQVIKVFNSDRPVVCGTKDPSGSSHIVPDHAYALVDYDADTKRFQLFNPWGFHTGHLEPGLIWLTWTEITAHYDYWHVGSKV